MSVDGKANILVQVVYGIVSAYGHSRKRGYSVSRRTRLYTSSYHGFKVYRAILIVCCTIRDRTLPGGFDIQPLGRTVLAVHAFRRRCVLQTKQKRSRLVRDGGIGLPTGTGRGRYTCIALTEDYTRPAYATIVFVMSR